MIQFLVDHLQEIKCKVHLEENHITSQWKLQNFMVFDVEMLVENATLSTLDLHLEKHVRMHRFQNDYDDGYLHVTIDILGTKSFNEDFLNAITFFLVPRLPAVSQISIPPISN